MTNHEERITCNQIKFKSLIRRSNFHDYSDAYVHVKGTITVPNSSTSRKPKH